MAYEKAWIERVQTLSQKDEKCVGLDKKLCWWTDEWWNMKVFLRLLELLKRFLKCILMMSRKIHFLGLFFWGFFKSVKNTILLSTAHTFPFAAYWNKLHPHVARTHCFNSVSGQLHVNCLQSHINLNVHLKYLWKILCQVLLLFNMCS